MNNFGLETVTWQSPTDDVYMEYDYRLHMYVVTEKAIKDLLGKDLLEFTGKQQSLFKRQEYSEDVYNAIRKFSTYSGQITKEYYLANALELRETILRVLLAQVQYSVRSGGNFLKDQHGVSANKGTQVNMRGYSIGERPYDILEGIGMMYTGTLLQPNMDFTRGVDY